MREAGKKIEHPMVYSERPIMMATLYEVFLMMSEAGMAIRK